MPTRKPLNHWLKGKIHQLVQQKGLDTRDPDAASAYRQMLQTHGGASSTTQMDDTQLRRVLHHLGYRQPSAGQANQSPGNPNANAPHNLNQRPRLKKIGALLADMKLPWNYAHAIGKTQGKKDRLEWLTDQQLDGVISALQRKQNKDKKCLKNKP